MDNNFESADEENSNINCDSNEYISSIQTQWGKIIGAKNANDNRTFTGEFKQLLQMLYNRARNCGLYIDETDDNRNGYRYFLTVKKALKNGIEQNCTPSDFFIADQTWTPVLDKYIELTGENDGSIVWKNARLVQLNKEYPIFKDNERQPYTNLIIAIKNERKCLSTMQSLGKFFRITPKGGRKTRRQKKSKKSRKSKRRRNRKTRK